MPPKAVDESGHVRVLAHLYVPLEAERRTGREVECRGSASIVTIAVAGMVRLHHFVRHCRGPFSSRARSA